MFDEIAKQLEFLSRKRSERTIAQHLSAAHIDVKRAKIVKVRALAARPFPAGAGPRRAPEVPPFQRAWSGIVGSDLESLYFVDHLVRAVSIRMGVVKPRWRSSWHTSKPPLPGSMTSKMIKPK